MNRLTITALSKKGEGITTYNGKPAHLLYTAVGDEVTAHLTKATQPNFQLEVDSILKESPMRITPPCPYFTKCGGCRLQHLNSEAYQQFKLDRFFEAIDSLTTDESIIAPLFTVPIRARRRFTLQINQQVGFYQAHSHTVVPIEHCLILDPKLNDLLSPLSHALTRYHHQLSNAQVTLCDNGIDILLELKAKPTTALEQEWITSLLALNPQIKRLSIRYKNRLTTLIEILQLTVTFGKYAIRVPPGIFLQATQEAQEEIIATLSRFLPKKAIILDLFGGLGSYSFGLIDYAKKISLFEHDKTMVEAVNSAAKSLNLYPRIEAYNQDLQDSPLLPKMHKHADVAIINPPRAGAASQIKQLRHAEIPTILMVSCNPTTFHRDAHYLIEGGYKLIYAKPLDQFIYNPHLEVIGVFYKQHPHL